MLRCRGDPREGPTLATRRGIQERVLVFGFLGVFLFFYFFFKIIPEHLPRTFLIFATKLEKVRTLKRASPSYLVRLPGPLDGHPDRFVSLK